MWKSPHARIQQQQYKLSVGWTCQEPRNRSSHWVQRRQFVFHDSKSPKKQQSHTQEPYESENSSSPALHLQPSARKNNHGKIQEQGVQKEPSFSWHIFLVCTQTSELKIKPGWLCLTATYGPTAVNLTLRTCLCFDLHSIPWQRTPHVKMFWMQKSTFYSF